MNLELYPSQPKLPFWPDGTDGIVLVTHYGIREEQTNVKIHWLIDNLGTYGEDWLYVGMAANDKMKMKINFRFPEDALRFKLTFGN